MEFHSIGVVLANLRKIVVWNYRYYQQVLICRTQATDKKVWSNKLSQKCRLVLNYLV